MNTKSKLVAIEGYAVEFYKKDGDEKYSFRIKGSELFTERLLANCKKKRVKPEDLYYAIRGIGEKIRGGILTTQEATPARDYTSELNLKVQRKYGESIHTEVVDFDIHRTIVKIYTPFGIFDGVGRNKVLARNDASVKALKEMERR